MASFGEVPASYSILGFLLSGGFQSLQLDGSWVSGCLSHVFLPQFRQVLLVCLTAEGTQEDLETGLQVDSSLARTHLGLHCRCGCISSLPSQYFQFHSLGSRSELYATLA